MTEEHPLPAGDFSTWLHHTRCALANESGSDVPCGECSACCTSSYFIHIRPEETRTLARIPKVLLFPAPGLSKGNMLLGYDEHGRCPMFIDNRCSIYEDRPLTCRGYDCRLFAATGIEAGDNDKALIDERVRRWRFSYPTPLDRDLHSALQAAATFLRERADRFPPGTAPKHPTQLALLALKVHEVFLKENGAGERDDGEIVKKVMEVIEREALPPDGR